MDINKALKMGKRKADFKPTREGLSAVELISERNRWWDGLPQHPDMDWQIRGQFMSELGRRHRGAWSCMDCKQAAVYEDTDSKDYYIHKCPLWKPLPPQTRAEIQRSEDELDRQWNSDPPHFCGGIIP